MGIFDNHNIGVLIFGLLGNIVSFVVFLAPVPTFIRVIRKKSTEGFQSVPYVVALFSGMMWLYYASLKTDETLLITINSVGCVIETIYIFVYITYAPKQARLFTLRLLLLLNFGGFCSVLLLSHFLTKGPNRIRVLGWLNVAFAVSVFAAPLSIIRVVIRTKSVEFMPFPLSFFLTLSAIMWLCYGILLKDFYVALPNILGLVFGILQMILYVVYKKKNIAIVDQQLPQHKADVKVNVEDKLNTDTPVITAEVQIICTRDDNKDHKDSDEKDMRINQHNENDHNHHHPNQKSMEDCYSIVEVQPPATVKCEA